MTLQASWYKLEMTPKSFVVLWAIPQYPPDPLADATHMFGLQVLSGLGAL